MRSPALPARLVQRCVLCLLLAVAGLAQAAAPRHWTIVDLGGEDYGTHANAVNNRGEVSGWFYVFDPAPWHHAFVWSNGTMQDLGAPQGNHSSNAQGMNNHGLIAGDGDNGIALVWDNGQWIPLGVRGAANDANEGGTVVGSYWAGTQTHCFTYRDGALQDIGTLGGGDCVAWAVNNGGLVTGYSYIAGSTTLHAFVYQGGTMQDLGTLGGRSSYAFDVNDNGTVVGAAEDATGRLVAMIYDSTGMRPLFDLPGNHAARAINNRGDVIGSFDNGSFLYEGGAVTRLESIPEVAAAGWTRLSPVGINDRGWIVGVGSRNGVGRSFLLKPQ